MKQEEAMQKLAVGPQDFLTIRKACDLMAVRNFLPAHLVLMQSYMKKSNFIRKTNDQKQKQDSMPVPTKTDKANVSETLITIPKARLKQLLIEAHGIGVEKGKTQVVITDDSELSNILAQATG